MGVRRYFSKGGQSRHFAYLFQAVVDAMQMDVYEKSPVLQQQLYTWFSLKEALHWANVCFSEHVLRLSQKSCKGVTNFVNF